MDDYPEPRFEHPYYFLWHLVAMGVIEVDEKTGMQGATGAEPGCPTIRSTVWDDLTGTPSDSPKTRIAMIDVGCSRNHPNLQGRVSHELSIDLAAHPFGAKLLPVDDASSPAPSTAFFEDLPNGVPMPSDLGANDQAYLTEFVETLAESRGIVRRFGDVEEKFSSHGTAIAGLLVGAPATGETRTDQILPYFGVDPFSELISIRTSFDNDPAQMLAALLYAWMHKADVIVLPRGLPDPERRRMKTKIDMHNSLESWKSCERNDLLVRIETLEALAGNHDPNAPDNGKSSEILWRITKHLLIEISKTIPVVCAAGNEGESQMIYPASLAHRENGIIAVGSVTSEGLRSGYSNYGDGLTVVAPSDDMEVHNRYQVRTNWKEYQARKDRFPIPDAVMRLPRSPLSLLSTDLPGSFGYEGEDLEGFRYRDMDSKTARNGFYTTFGGTSGACALVAGVVALVRRAEMAGPAPHSRRDGPDIKKLLQDSARDKGPVLPGGPQMVGDKMNAPDEDAHPLTYFFGHGLVDARAAVAAALARAPA